MLGLANLTGSPVRVGHVFFSWEQEATRWRPSLLGWRPSPLVRSKKLLVKCLIKDLDSPSGPESTLEEVITGTPPPAVAETPLTTQLICT